MRGITVRSRSIFGTIGGRCRPGRREYHAFQHLCEQTRADAFGQMSRMRRIRGQCRHWNVRRDEIINGVTEVLCYGTAVVIEQADHGSQP